MTRRTATVLSASILAFICISLSVAYFVGGFGNQAEHVPASKPLKMEDDSQRFTVTSHGHFAAGYEDHKREILVIHDTKTGKQYLTVTGCGTTELWTVKSGERTFTGEE